MVPTLGVRMPLEDVRRPDRVGAVLAFGEARADHERVAVEGDRLAEVIAPVVTSAGRAALRLLLVRRRRRDRSRTRRAGGRRCTDPRPAPPNG